MVNYFAETGRRLDLVARRFPPFSLLTKVLSSRQAQNTIKVRAAQIKQALQLGLTWASARHGLFRFTLSLDYTINSE